MISSASPINRVIHAPTLLPEPVTFKFDPNTPEDEQDSVIKSHFAGIQANRNVDRVGPAGALGIMLGQAQNALFDRKQDEGPRLIRSGPVWGMAQESTDNMFNQVLQNNQRAQEAEMQRKENLAKRAVLLDQMEEERAMKEREIKLNLNLKQMEHEAALDEERRKNEFQTKRDQTQHENRMALEEAKAKSKPPKLVSAYDAKTGTYTLQPESEGLVTKGPKSAQDINKAAFDYANHLMGYEFVDEATGESTPMDFKTATEAGHAMAQGQQAEFTMPGIKLVKREEQDLVPATDAEGKQTLVNKGKGVVTKEPQKPDRREVTTEYKMQWDIAKDTLKEAQLAMENVQTDPERPGYDAENLNRVKADVAAAEAEVKKARAALQSHLTGDKAADTSLLPPEDLAPTPVGDPVPRKLKDGTTVNVQQMSDGTYQEVQ